jgi:hypothetical protein
MQIVETIIPTFGVYLSQSPIYLVWLAGIILAIVYRERHSRVSLLTGVALGVLLVETVIGTYLSVSLPVILFRRGIDASAIAPILNAVNCVRSLIAAAMWGLLLVALFGWRQSPAPEGGVSA